MSLLYRVEVRSVGYVLANSPEDAEAMHAEIVRNEPEVITSRKWDFARLIDEWPQEALVYHNLGGDITLQEAIQIHNQTIDATA